MRKIILILFTLFTFVGTADAKRHKTINIDSHLNMSIIGGNAMIAIIDSNDADNIENVYIVNFGDIHSALKLVNDLSNELSHFKNDRVVSYRLANMNVNFKMKKDSSKNKCYSITQDGYDYFLYKKNLIKIEKKLIKNYY